MNLMVYNLLEKSRDLFEDGKHEKAFDFIERAYEKSDHTKEKIELLFEKAMMLDEIDFDKEALIVYQNISKLDPKNAAALYGQAMISEKMGLIEDAERFYKACIEIDPNYDRAFFFLANLYDVNGRYEDAISYYKKAMYLVPEDNMIYNNLGAIYENIKEYDKAMIMLDKAIELDETYFRPFFNKGVVYGKLGNTTKAIEYYQESIKKEPSYNNNYLNMSAIYIEEDALLDAVNILNKGINLAHDKAYLYYNRACIKMKLKNIDIALLDLENAIKLDPLLKEYARDDIDFISVRDDKRFLEITGEVDDIFEK